MMLPQAGDRAIILVQTDAGIVRADVVISHARVRQGGKVDRGTGVATFGDSEITIEGRGPGFVTEGGLDALPT